jgi:hypothetical protein
LCISPVPCCVLAQLRAHLNLCFPGTDGGIDFDAVRVSEEVKQACTLKNKGKYDISYACVQFHIFAEFRPSLVVFLSEKAMG